MKRATQRWAAWLLTPLLGTLPGHAGAAGPLDVQVTPDATRTVTGTFTSAGGTVTVKAADGTVFSLSAPPNAVLSTLNVRMTPVSKLGGLKGARGYVAAVHLEPEGMEFLEPLTLKITAPQALQGTVRALNSHALGRDLYVQPRQLDGKVATLQLTHFSNPGVADLEWTEQDVPVPTSPRDRLETDLATRERSSLLILGDYAAFLSRDLDRAAQSDAALRQAVREFLSWRKEVERLGLNDRFKAEIYQGWTKIAAGIDAAVTRAHTACVTGSDFRKVTDILGWVLWVKRNPRLAPYFAGRLAAFEAKAAGCATFEVNFDFQMTEHTTYEDPGQPGFMIDDVTSRHHVQATVPVQYNLTRGSLEGRGPIRTLQFAAQGRWGAILNKDPGCAVREGRTLDRSGQGGDFMVGGDRERRTEIPLVSLLIEPDGRTSETQTLTLVAMPGILNQTFQLNCPARSGEFAPPGDHGDWPTLFRELNGFPGELQRWWYVPLTFQQGAASHRQDHRYAGPPLPLDDRDDEDARQMTVQGVTTLKVRHTPR